MKSKKKYIVWITVAVIILLVIVVVCLTGKKGRSEKVGGEVFAVKKGNVTNFTEQTGIIKAQVGAIVKVGTRATGELIQLRYQVGDYVKKGELIAKIDDREKIANHRNLKAQIEEQRKDLAAKEAQYQYSKINYEREERLLKQEFTTRDSVDKAKRELDVAIAQVELGRAKVMAAEESLKALEVSLSYNKIYAPISGYVSQVTTQEGETVVAGLSAVNLITVIDASKLEMWIYVDETDIGRVKPGMKVEYWVDAYRDRRFSGNISLIYPQPEIKENIVYYLAIVKIDPKDTTLLKPEMTTHVRIIISEKTDVLVVPNGSVRFESGKNIVYVKSKDKTERKEVIPGIRDDKFTEIITGLSENEHVVIPTVKRLESGAKK
ncbi:MAG TPA: efflux RND transporter periplasmic adaptor subunit [Syntrophorhabdaceae bacterium]|jgi:RND family efflux transporter MFP subunit|nr:efflux RND transporter periplasmic adaptor subunit [Syntrophorhabdaceae bacterium]MDI9561991.1 efflux RND transporter periplasmic adaptor subunit [Pseudomonadota bacterium]HPH42553.1 efflux RND transporter periplasmic adaptor subunit [Syntrophorhabdaceae bacterium]HQG50964.1 efflux RND transporter periplasmic adaptor subunit [Syntrophorhabdaceae bacterium]HQJ93861.1 efflux RND transporter periplasmic adaptor subunit [Syntrophorhabdaceae bacterium]